MAARYMSSAGRPSLQPGLGVGTRTGSPLGLAVVPDDPKVDPNNSGQIVNDDASIIESSSELEDSLKLSIGAEMRYGLFSAAGKFEMREKSQYKSFAIRVGEMRRAQPPPVGFFDPRPKPDAEQFVDRGRRVQKSPWQRVRQGSAHWRRVLPPAGNCPRGNQHAEEHRRQRPGRVQRFHSGWRG